MKRYFSERDRGWILLLLAAAALVYLPFLGNPLIFDDTNVIRPAVMEYFAATNFSLELRWLANISLFYTYEVFSDEHTHMYHLGNLLIHGANAILLFYLLRRLMAAAVPELQPERLRNAALLGALVFAVHPVAVYAVGYVVQRSILMATMFTLLMQLAFLKGLLSGRRRWLAAAVLAYFLACFSKEHSVLAPGLLLAMVLLLRGQIRLSRPVWMAVSAAFVAVALLITWVTVLSKSVLDTPYEVMANQMFQQQNIDVSNAMLHGLSAMTQAGLFFKYLGLWLFPNVAWMSIDMRMPFIASLADGWGWAGVIGFLGYGLAGLALLLQGGKRGLFGFALLYPWLQYWVELVGIRVQEPFVLYRTYLWMPGLMLFVVWLAVVVRLRHFWWAATVVLLLLTALSWNRLWIFADNHRLWNEAAVMLPNDEVAGADRIYYNRAYFATQAKQWAAAVPDYEKVARMDPLIAVVRHDLGVTYFNTGRLTDALTQFESAIALDPDYAMAYFNRALTLKYLHRDEMALQSMRKSCELKYAMACAIVEMERKAKKK